MPTNLLSEKGKDGRTVFHIAAVDGKIEIVKAIVEKDEKLVMIKSKSYSGCIPIMVAAEAGNKDVVNYLYPITISQEGNQKEGHNDEREKTKATILTSLIFGDFYRLALDLLKKCPHLLLTKDDFKLTAMEVLAMKHSAFQSSLPTKRIIATLGYSFLNSCSNDKPMFGPISNYPQLLWLCFRRLLQNALIKFGEKLKPNHPIIIIIIIIIIITLIAYIYTLVVPGCRYIYDEKLKHYGASKLVKEVWRVISQHDDLQSVKDVVVTAMFIATRNGIVEFIEECINNCPQLLMNKGDKYKSQTIFHYAISNRQEKIFGLIHHLGPLKHDLAMMKDASENCMSHLVATEIPIERLNQVPGAALQMQRELLWYKEVGSIMPSAHELFENKDQKTPRVLFTENHK
ncbi:uncharacterized protein LOC122075768 isoform X2 [Macadamia integrifolia]|uniref:uncharacterized protein LOC122075768 isoform X2 n=1 Tax=Macadamia integrifolia TaxID=60698 RepID=UPI001C5001AB|nr:uncharacterized protein LOC122075768 isoform X2 [Macadamia integrifolia]